MPTRGPIAKGFLDELFARREVSSTADLLPIQVAPDQRTRKKVTRSAGTNKRKGASPKPELHTASGPIGVALGERQIVFIDSLVEALRSAGMRKAGRDQVVRTLIDALQDSQLDFSRTASLESLKTAVTANLASPSLLRLPQAILEASLNLLRPAEAGRTDHKKKPTGRR